MARRTELASTVPSLPPVTAAPKVRKPRTPAIASGEVGSGLEVVSGIPNIEYLAELDFPDYIREFKRLENDPAIAKSLKANMLPIMNADWSMEPASDDERDKVIAEFVGANLYQQEGDYFGSEFWCRTPWVHRLRDVLRILAHGFSIFQKLYRQQGRFTVFDKIKYLTPESIIRWRFDEADNFLGVDRTYVGADGKPRTLEPLDAEQLLVCTWDQEGSNILGKPLIRPVWQDFKIKQKIKKLSIIDKQKTSVGVPYFKNAADDDPREKARADRVAKAMRGGNYENLWVRLREGQDFGWKEGGQSTKGLPDLVRLCNEEMSGALGDRFMDLGVAGSGGTRALGGTQAAFSALLISAILKVVLSYEDMLGAELVDMNFMGVARRPRAKASDVDPFEKTRTLPDFMANMGTGKAITKTRDTENEIRRRYEFMEIDEEQYDELNAAAPMPTPAAPGVPSEDGTGGPQPPEALPAGKGDAAPSAVAAQRIALAATADEVLQRSRIDLQKMRGELERFESLYYGSLSQVQKDMRGAIVEKVRAGAFHPRKAREVQIPYQDELRDRLLAIVKSARDYGRETIVDEVGAQLRQLARRPISNPTTRRQAIAFSNDQAQVRVDLDVSDLVARLQSQTVAEYNRLVGLNTAVADIADQMDSFLQSISDRQIQDMARGATSLAFNQGRNVAIMEHRAQLGDYAIRIEVDPGDPNTCEPCQALNGQEFKIGTPEYFRNQAPAHCLGKLRCRGFMVVQPKEAAA